MLVAALAAAAARGEPIQVSSAPVPLDAADPQRATLGGLTYQGGVRLTSAHPDFGGWSGLWISPDGARLVAVSDRGHWLTAALSYSGEGRLTGLAEANLFPMLDTQGIPLAPPWSDAESIAAGPGGFVVAFERAHRLWWYAAAAPARLEGAVAAPMEHPDAMHDAPANGGIEALTDLGGGAWLALAEDLVRGEGLGGWRIGSGGAAEALTYRAQDGFVPTGAATLATGDVLVLERRFNLTGLRTRLRRIDGNAARGGESLSGQLIATLARPLVVENFEGLAAVADAGGTRVFLLSDDNFSALQRTLLLMFRLD